MNSWYIAGAKAALRCESRYGAPVGPSAVSWFAGYDRVRDVMAEAGAVEVEAMISGVPDVFPSDDEGLEEYLMRIRIKHGVEA